MHTLRLSKSFSMRFDWDKLYVSGDIEVQYMNDLNLIKIEESTLATTVRELYKVSSMLRSSTTYYEKYILYKWVEIYRYYFSISSYDILRALARVMNGEFQHTNDVETPLNLKRTIVEYRTSEFNEAIDELINDLMKHLNLPSSKNKTSEYINAVFKACSKFKIEDYTLSESNAQSISNTKDSFLRVKNDNFQLFHKRYNWTATVDMLSPVVIGKTEINYRKLKAETKNSGIPLKLNVRHIPDVYIMSVLNQMGVAS